MKSDNSKLSLEAQHRRLLLQTIGGGALIGGMGLSWQAMAQSLADKPPGTTRNVSGSGGLLDVVIIGAGLSGLTTARDLSRAGCESFLVLEARDRVGGRTYNHQLGNGVISEAGGQWIGPTHTAIADLARQLEVDTFPTYYRGKSSFIAGDTVAASEVPGGGGASSPRLVSKLNALARGVSPATPWAAENAAELDKLSFGAWLQQEGASVEDQIGYDSLASLTFGTTPGALGLLQYLGGVNAAGCKAELLEAVEGGIQETRFVGGSQILSLKIAETMSDKIKLSSPVSKIVGWDRDVIEVHTDQGVMLTRQVVTAINPALCNQIVFDPPLPEGRNQLQQHWPAHAPMRKTVHVYSRPFWREKGLNGQIVQVDGPLNWAYDNSPPDGSIGVLNAFIRPAQLSHDPKQAETTLSQIYAKALGEEALNPLQFHDHDWGKVDQWTLHCMHPIPPGFWTKWGPFLNPPAGGLIWSGTETAANWAGTMEGAVIAGRQAALHVLNALVQNKRSMA